MLLHSLIFSWEPTWKIPLGEQIYWRPLYSQPPSTFISPTESLCGSCIFQFVLFVENLYGRANCAICMGDGCENCNLPKYKYQHILKCKYRHKYQLFDHRLIVECWIPHARRQWGEKKAYARSALKYFNIKLGPGKKNLKKIKLGPEI